MCDERCSANFMLPEQVSPFRSSVRCASGRPLRRPRYFGCFKSTWLRRSARGASSPARLARRAALRSSFTPLRPSPLRALPAYQFTEARQRSREAAESCKFHFFLYFLEEPQGGSVTLLRPSPGQCADIAVRHRFRNLSDVVASAARAARGGGGTSSGTPVGSAGSRRLSSRS